MIVASRSNVNSLILMKYMRIDCANISGLLGIPQLK